MVHVTAQTDLGNNTSKLSEKKSHSQGQHIIQFHFYEMSRVDKSIETENILVVAQD